MKVRKTEYVYHVCRGFENVEELKTGKNWITH